MNNIKYFYAFLITGIIYFGCGENLVRPKVQKPFVLTSAVFSDNDTIGDAYSCKAGVSEKMPPLLWNNSPNGAKSYVLIVEDPDAIAVVGYTWIHRVVFNLNAENISLAEGLKNMKYSGSALRGTTSFGDTLGGGPCPPAGQLHHYKFKLFALNKMLNLKSGATVTQIRSDMNTAILDSAVLTGLFIQ